MKTLIISISILFLVWSGLSAQSKIPKEMPGTWVLKIPGEGEIPSQIMKWVFYLNDSGEPISEFHWLFKRAEDKDYLTVAAIRGNLVVDKDIITSTTFMVGTQQVAPFKLEFYDEVKWYSQGDPEYEKYPKSESHHFEIAGNKLLIKDDVNNDGDYDDADELTTFTKIDL